MKVVNCTRLKISICLWRQKWWQMQKLQVRTLVHVLTGNHRLYRNNETAVVASGVYGLCILKSTLTHCRWNTWNSCSCLSEKACKHSNTNGCNAQRYADQRKTCFLMLLCWAFKVGTYGDYLWCLKLNGHSAAWWKLWVLQLVFTWKVLFSLPVRDHIVTKILEPCTLDKIGVQGGCLTTDEKRNYKSADSDVIK